MTSSSSSLLASSLLSHTNSHMVPLIQAFPWTTFHDEATTTTTTTTSTTATLKQRLDAKRNYNHSRSFLVTDSVETDGRFVLYTMVCDALTMKKSMSVMGRGGAGINTVRDSIGSTGTVTRSTTAESYASSMAVLWLSCGPWTEGLIATALRKMGCDVAAMYLKRTVLQQQEQSKSSTWDTLPLAIHCIMTDNDFINNIAGMSKTDGSTTYLENLYQRIKIWYTMNVTKNTNVVVVLDDVSSLANVFGIRLVYAFISQVRSLILLSSSLKSSSCDQSSNSNHNKLILRCSNEVAQVQASMQNSDVNHHHARNVDYPNHQVSHWVGVGGGHTFRYSSAIPPQEQELYQHVELSWEHVLCEWMDWIVDVIPLTSGYSREAHGRLVCTQTHRQHQQQQHGHDDGEDESKTKTCPTVVVMNYCLQDTSVAAIRLQQY